MAIRITPGILDGFITYIVFMMFAGLMGLEYSKVSAAVLGLSLIYRLELSREKDKEEYLNKRQRVDMVIYCASVAVAIGM